MAANEAAVQQQAMSPEERGRALAGDMPWVTERLTPEQAADLPKQLAAAIREAERAMKRRCARACESICQVAVEAALHTKTDAAHQALNNQAAGAAECAAVIWRM